jgi:N4-gp56 family major capsid protein
MAVMTTSLTTPGNLTSTMQIFYDKVFLERAEAARRYDFLAVKKTVPKNSGKVVYFTRYTPFAVDATAITEGVNPSESNSTASTVIATAAIYGGYERVSTFFEMTSIDAGLKEHIENFGQWAGEKMDYVLGSVICAGATMQCAASKQLTAIGSTDTLSVVELRRAVKTLFDNKAPKFENGNYRAVVSSQGGYELRGDTQAGNWLNVHMYNSGENAEKIKQGKLGTLYNVDIVETNVNFTRSSTVTLYSNFVAGKGSIAEVDISGSGNFGVSVVRGADAANPLNLWSTVTWKVDAYTAVVLNSSWVVDIVAA